MYYNKNLIIRISMYKNILYRLRDLGFVKVFIDNLANSVGVTSSIVRKDFNTFNIKGNKRGGYDIDELLNKLKKILGKNTETKIIIVGVGKIGRALIEYNGFREDGINIIAGFDINEANISQKLKFPIYPINQLSDFVKNNKIKIAIISVPKAATQQVLDILIMAGVKGILNFAPSYLQGNDDVIINNVNLEIELENVIYFVNNKNKTPD